MNVFVVREIKDAFETVKDLEKIGVKSKSFQLLNVIIKLFLIIKLNMISFY